MSIHCVCSQTRRGGITAAGALLASQRLLCVSGGVHLLGVHPWGVYHRGGASRGTSTRRVSGGLVFFFQAFVSLTQSSGLMGWGGPMQLSSAACSQHDSDESVFVCRIALLPDFGV